ncbi:MAG: DUF4268 domain-containing protein [Planctomycetes bacterium]|nr:DUF4268 domain-containing protein [Planctomycetota bacterium]
MGKESLGKLAPVELRDYWEREDTDFTQWLAEAENLALLSEALKLDLAFESTETNVGLRKFRADIICRNIEDNSRVVIENQLEVANHNHLGQLFTYAAGLDDVKTLIWIVKELTPDHRAALDWLNRITHEDYNFFGVEMELWRIDESRPAPKFNVVVQPNDWSRIVQEAAGVDSGELSEGKKLQIEYWSSLGDFIRKTASKVKPPKPNPTNWVGYGGLSKSGAGFLLILNQRDAAVALQINRQKYPTWFDQLQTQADAISRELGFTLEWDDGEGKKYAMARYKKQVDVMDRSQWPALHKWMIDGLETMRRVFKPRIAMLESEGVDELAQ